MVVVAALAGGCSSSGGHAGGPPDDHDSDGPLVAPKTSYAEDTAYFQDLAKVDPGLSSYVDSNRAVALQALLTDGAAFCAFLKRGGGVDNAMESVVIGASSVESKTHLPTSVATFNAIDAVALSRALSDRTEAPARRRPGHIDSLSKLLSEPAGTG